MKPIIMSVIYSTQLMLQLSEPLKRCIKLIKAFTKTHYAVANFLVISRNGVKNSKGWWNERKHSLNVREVDQGFTTK
ncbi:CLUMA_CG021627, isoform A [Clunio marinus]|uniref:CLUMA_CG021627, isoform A n=1 Tax=Clunio marinus TaxID=568069 RepID=A0A1J1J8B5_9DIPT|nr:CLUMA_CG021627, isoform A [Clunio marinus]